MSERAPGADPEATSNRPESELELAIIGCVCEGRLRLGDFLCPDCAIVYEGVRAVLNAERESLTGNPVWVLGAALSRVIGVEKVDWDEVRRLAVEFEEPPGEN